MELASNISDCFVDIWATCENLEFFGPPATAVHNKLITDSDTRFLFMHHQ